MSTEKKTIKVTCNNFNCFFVETYHQFTLESLIEYRKIMAQIPIIDDECLHTDVSFQELKIA